MSITSKIGIGTVQFGLDYGVSNVSGKTEIHEVKNILDLSKSIGIKIIDTARSYGDSEAVLGKCDVSNNFRVISKFMPSVTDGEIYRQFEQSCNNLKSDQGLYAYLAHRPLSLIENHNDWEIVQELKSKKLVQKIGFSLNSPVELDLLYKEGITPDIIQVPYNYFDRRFEDWMIKLKKQGCEIHSRSSFLQGLFFVNTNSANVFFDEVKEEIRLLQKSHQSNLSSVLLKYVLSKSFIDIVIMGIENTVQLRNNILGAETAVTIQDLNRKISETIIVPANWPKR